MDRLPAKALGGPDGYARFAVGFAEAVPNHLCQTVATTSGVTGMPATKWHGARRAGSAP